MAIETWRAFADLDPDETQAPKVLPAVTGSNLALLKAWLSGEVAARTGLTVGWTQSLAWWAQRAGLTYRDPTSPFGTAPTVGRIWPR